jgi:hypothetical protein
VQGSTCICLMQLELFANKDRRVSFSAPAREKQPEELLAEGNVRAARQFLAREGLPAAVRAGAHRTLRRRQRELHALRSTKPASAVG